MKNVHVHVHGALDTVFVQPAPVRTSVRDDADSYKRDQQGRFATSSGTGEQHSATAALHESLATRKGTDHPHHAFHMAAAEAHTSAANFLSQANKAQHPGAAIAAEHAAKQARTHENVINKGRGSDPQGEIARQNKGMSDPGVAKGNKERMDDLDAKYPAKGAKAKPKAKTKDGAHVGCGCVDADMMGAPIDGDTNLFDYGPEIENIARFNKGEPVKTADAGVLFFDHSGWQTQDDWAAWNAKHGGKSAKQVYPVGSRVRMHHSQEVHEVSGHKGAGLNSILLLKSGGHMPAHKALHHEAKPKTKAAASPSINLAAGKKLGRTLLKVQKEAHENAEYKPK